MVRVDDLIEKLQSLMDSDWQNVFVEINGRTDHDIKEIYIDGAKNICIAIELDEDYKKYL